MCLHETQPKPDVIIIDFLHTFFDDLSTLETDDRLQEHFIECHMLIVAALHGAVDMLANGRNDHFISITCIDTERHCIYKRFIQTFVDLYYYKERCIISPNHLVEHFP